MPPEHSIAGAVGDKPRVVIADDDGTVRYLARLAMEDSGFEVIEATDGRDAIEAIEWRYPELVLLDVTMPVMDGFEVCAALRRLPGGDRIPVIIITGLDDAESIDAAYEAGATDFVTKPINFAALCHRVRYIMRASRALNDLWESQKRLLNAQRVADLGDWDWELESSCFRASEQVYRILGRSADNALSIEALLASVHREDYRRVRAAIDGAIELGESFTIDHRIVSPGGEVCFVYHQVEPGRTDATGRANRLVGTIQDITRRKRSEERIRQLAYFDALTGLPNRVLLVDQLRSAIAHAQRSGSKLAVMFVDLDGFKRVNDTLGHDAGDELLRIVADRISRSVRTTDAVARVESEEPSARIARLGGDEFVVVLGDVKQPEDATRVGRRILHALLEPMQIAAQEIVISCSIGIALYPQDGDTSETLLMNADAAMYCAKRQGRNTFQYYDASMNAKAREKLALESSLRKALERGEMILHFQPQVDQFSGEIAAVEALMRWQRPGAGLVGPADFIPLAEESGLIVPLGEWLLRAACAQNKAWQDAGLPPIGVAVNVSAVQFGERLVRTVAQLLEETGLDPACLELEVTESVLVQDIDAALRTLQRLKDIGVRLAIDDFGTGYSSLSYLKRFPVDALKIDRSFVRDVITDPEDAAITSAIIALARNLNLQVIAEGVETAEQSAFLRQRGCHLQQGYFFSRPLPAADFARYLGKHDNRAARVPVPLEADN
jgi:diguanylate cyclase (GGDEF)-like protein/PAS domain S-box-containing protein